MVTGTVLLPAVYWTTGYNALVVLEIGVSFTYFSNLVFQPAAMPDSL